MVLLTPAPGTSLNRMAAIRTAEGLPKQRWIQPQGTGVRVALESGAPLAGPAGYTLTPVPPSLEDAYIWLSGAAGEVRVG